MKPGLQARWRVPKTQRVNRSRREYPRPRADGFTLIELTIVIALMSVLGALGLTALVNYQRSADIEGSATTSSARCARRPSGRHRGSYVLRGLDVTANTYTSTARRCSSTAS